MVIQLPQDIPNYDEHLSDISEPVILCDEHGNATGVAEKLAIHHAHTPRHIAFSCYIFNDNQDLLVTQRAQSKKVWPGVWTNTACGHPMPGETFEQAIARRLLCELGLTALEITVVLPDYHYTTPAFNGIIENELCPVFFAKANANPAPNPKEVAAYQWLSWDEYGKLLTADIGNEFSWWSKDQYEQLQALPQTLRFTSISE